MISVRSLRVRLSILYVVLTMSWMSAVGVFTFLYLRNALAASRAETMARREQRLVNYVNDEYAHFPGLSLQEQLRLFMDANTTPNDLVRIFDLNGRLLYMYGYPSADIGWSGQNCTRPCFNEIALDHHRLRTISHRTMLDGHPVNLYLGGSMDEHYDLLDHVIRSYLIAAPLMLLASIAGGLVLSRRAMEPVDRITRDARLIGIQNLKRRLPVPNTRDELQRLTETWNELLERLDAAVSRLRQFTSDVSHDLRTSTTVVFATAQVALRIDRTPAEYRTALQTIAQECQATTHLLDDLLAIATADLGDAEVARLPVNLAEVVEEVSSQMQAHAKVKHQTLECRGPDDGWILGDLQMLRRLTSILLDNAVKYTPESGTISASVTTTETSVALEVADTGVGIAPEHAARIFDRFFRGDPARARDGGHGLGLAIAKWIADSHDSAIQVSSARGRGSTFTVVFSRYRFEQRQSEPYLLRKTSDKLTQPQ